MSVGLTPNQAAALTFARTFIAENGFSPSMEEIGMALGIASRSGAHRILHCLEQRGYVRLTPRLPRSLEVVSAEPPMTTREELDRLETHVLVRIAATVEDILFCRRRDVALQRQAGEARP